MFSLDDTIVAIASAPGGAARGIVRLSGPKSIEIVGNVFAPTDSSVNLVRPAQASCVDGELGALDRKIPARLFIWPTNRSYTRQPVAEVHTLGSPPVLEAIARALCSVGARLAQPGEFTLRAFLAGRIDLTQAEAVLGVIDATDRRQLQTALAQLAGGFSEPLVQLRSDLLNLLADLEAGLDFTEEDIRFVSPEDMLTRVAAATERLGRLSQQLGTRAITGRLPRVALVGPPNAGKSSLFNAFVGEGAAIVSPQAGTTRDYLSAVIDADGLQIELIDTAGVSDGKSTAAAGVDHAAGTFALKQRIDADLILECREATCPTVEATPDDRSLPVVTKIDIVAYEADFLSNRNAIQTSSKTGDGLAELRSAIRQQLEAQTSSDVIASTAVRVGESLQLAADSLDRLRQLVLDGAGDELAAAELRVTLAELGKVVGAVYTDDLLDRIFSRFCIGK
jgi:tRNA modification GTPase